MRKQKQESGRGQNRYGWQHLKQDLERDRRATGLSDHHPGRCGAAGPDERRRQHGNPAPGAGGAPMSLDAALPRDSPGRPSYITRTSVDGGDGFALTRTDCGEDVLVALVPDECRLRSRRG